MKNNSIGKVLKLLTMLIVINTLGILNVKAITECNYYSDETSCKKNTNCSWHAGSRDSYCVWSSTEYFNCEYNLPENSAEGAKKFASIYLTVGKTKGIQTSYATYDSYSKFSKLKLEKNNLIADKNLEINDANFNKFFKSSGEYYCPASLQVFLTSGNVYNVHLRECTDEADLNYCIYLSDGKKLTDIGTNNENSVDYKVKIEHKFENRVLNFRFFIVNDEKYIEYNGTQHKVTFPTIGNIAFQFSSANNTGRMEYYYFDVTEDEFNKMFSKYHPTTFYVYDKIIDYSYRITTVYDPNAWEGSSASSQTSSKVDTEKITNCEVVPEVIKNYIKDALKLIRWIGLVAMIILGILDFVKASASDDQDALKKAWQSVIKRLIAVIILFLLPLLLELVLYIAGLAGFGCGEISEY